MACTYWKTRENENTDRKTSRDDVRKRLVEAKGVVVQSREGGQGCWLEQYAEAEE